MKNLIAIFIISFAFVNPTFAQRRGNSNGASNSRGSYHPGLSPQYGHRGGMGRPVRVINVVPHHMYEGMPRRGVVIREVPHETVIISRGSERYHYHQGVFYRPSRAGYEVVRAPIGIRVGVLPPGYFSFNFGPRPYYYYYGTYYSRVPDTEEYEVVPPPVGARVNALPDGYEKVSVDGMIYYLVDGTYYKAIVDEGGEVMYEVVGNKK